MKRFFSIILVLLLLLVTFPSLPASAAGEEYFYLNIFSDRFPTSSQLFLQADYENNIDTLIAQGKYSESILKNCNNSNLFIDAQTAESSLFTKFSSFITDRDEGVTGFLGGASFNTIRLCNSSKTYFQNMFPALYSFLSNPSAYNYKISLVMYSTVSVGFTIVFTNSNIDSSNDWSYNNQTGGFVDNNQYTNSNTYIAYFTFTESGTDIVFNNCTVLPNTYSITLLSNSMYRFAYTDFRIYLTYVANGYAGDSYADFSDNTELRSALATGIESPFLIDRRYILSNFGGSEDNTYPDGSGGTYANNLFMQDADFEFIHKNYYPPYNIMIDSGTIYPDGYVNFKGLLNDYQIDNVDNFTLNFKYSLYMDINYKNQGQNDFLWFKQTSSLTDNSLNLKVNFDMQEFSVPLSTFYNNNCTYSKSFEDLWNNLKYDNVSLMSCMRQMKELTHVEYNDFKLYCSVYLSSQGAKSGSYKEYYNPINRRGLTTDESIRQNTNPFILSPSQQNGTSTDFVVPGDAGSTVPGVSQSTGAISVVNNDNDTLDIESNWKYFIRTNPDNHDTNDNMSAVDYFREGYEVITTPDTNPLNSDFLQFLFAGEFWDIYPFNLIKGACGMLVTIAIFTAILRLFRR